MERLDDDDRLVAWLGRLRGVKEEKAAAAEMTAARIRVRTMVAVYYCLIAAVAVGVVVVVRQPLN